MYDQLYDLWCEDYSNEFGCFPTTPLPKSLIELCNQYNEYTKTLGVEYNHCSRQVAAAVYLFWDYMSK